MEEKTFTELVIEVMKNIPKGKVAAYGQIATLAGNPRGSRRVSWVLNSHSEREGLPWHRVINSKGMISLTGEGYDIQRSLLEAEGVVFKDNGKIDC